MASVLSSFLIGIGWDTKNFDKGTKNIERLLGGVKSTALQVGAALFTAFSAKSLTVDFAKRTDSISQFSAAIGVSADQVQALGNALAYAGGDASTSTALLQKLTDARDALAVKGEAGFLTDAAFSGIDPSMIKDAATSYDALTNIVGQFDSLSAAQQRTLAQTLGLSPSDIALFKTGRESVESTVESMRQIRPVTAEATENSRHFRGEMSLLGTQIGAVADQISVPLVGALGDATEAMNKFISANRPIIDETVAKGVSFASDNFTALAVAIGGLTARSTLATLGSLAKYIPGIGAGLGTIASNLGRVGTIAGIAGVSSVVANVADQTLSKNVPGYNDFDARVTKGIYDLIGFDLSRGNVYEGTERQSILTPAASVPNPFGQTAPTYTPGAGMGAMPSYPPVDLSRGNVYEGTARQSLLTPAPSVPNPFGQAASTYTPGAGMGAMPSYPPVQVTLQLDGRVLDERIIDVNERQASSVVEDLQTTTRR